MADVRDLVTWALQDIGVLAAGEIATADDALEGLAGLNALVDQLAAERLAVYTITRTVWTIAASTQNYTVGTGATVSVARPAQAEEVKANYYDSAESTVTELPLSRFTDDEWRGLVQKGTTATAPSAFYYAPTYPTGTISLWPVPTVSGLRGVLYAPEPVSEFAGLNTEVALPPGYRRMLRKNLAVELAPMFDKAISPELARAAAHSMSVVKRANVRMNELSLDDTLGREGGGYMYLTDTTR